MLGERLRLRVDSQLLVVGDEHRLRGVTPGGGLLVVDAELGGALGMARHSVDGRAQVPLGHQVRVDVVVGDGAVLVRSGDAVDPEAAGSVVVPQ